MDELIPGSLSHRVLLFELVQALAGAQAGRHGCLAAVGRCESCSSVVGDAVCLPGRQLYTRPPPSCLALPPGALACGSSTFFTSPRFTTGGPCPHAPCRLLVGAAHLALPSQAQLLACWVGSLRATMPTSSDVLRARAAQQCAKRFTAVGAHMACMSGGQLAAVVVARLVEQAHQPMLVRWCLPVMTRAIATLTKREEALCMMCNGCAAWHPRRLRKYVDARLDLHRI